MDNFINDEEMDTLNRYLDDMLPSAERAAFEQRMADTPHLAEMHQRFQDAVDQLGQAFGPSDEAAAEAVSSVMTRIKTEESQEDESGTKPVGFVNGTPWWRQAMAIAACAAVVALALFAGQLVSPFSSPATPEVSELYTQLVDNGFVAPLSCSPERFTGEMEERTGQPLLLAALTPNIELLGWSYPNFYGTPVIHESELALMARVDGRPVMILLHPSGADNLEPEPGIFVHRRRLGSLIGYEVSPFQAPRLINHLSVPE